jgi:2-methylcitrate dehydratase
MTEAEKLAAFVSAARFEDLPASTLEQLKLRILDSVGVAFGALAAEPVREIRRQIDEFGGAPLCTLIGGGATAPDRAAFFNSALVRYLDFMDSYLTAGETFHPSDNFGAVLAAAEYANADGKAFLIALAVAYEVQARLSTAAPVRAKGFDHTTQGAYAAAAGAAKALGLNVHQTANAIAMSGTANNALRVTRTGKLSNWKGLAYPNTAFSATHLTFLAMRGITGPLEVFEGIKGFKESISGPFFVDWDDKSFNSIERSIIKKYDAEIHSQSAIEGALELRAKHGFKGRDIKKIQIDTFQVAFDIIGGGVEGAKRDVHTKEEADHSLPYMIAVALLDGELTPRQYTPERIVKEDVQRLLQKVEIKPVSRLSARFPDEMPARIAITLRSGDRFEIKKIDYEGFHTRPMAWETVSKKFRHLSEEFLSPSTIDEVEDFVFRLDGLSVRDLTQKLSRNKSETSFERGKYEQDSTIPYRI